MHLSLYMYWVTFEIKLISADHCHLLLLVSWHQLGDHGDDNDDDNDDDNHCQVWNIFADFRDH